MEWGLFYINADIIRTKNGNLCIIQSYYYDNDIADYVYVNYGYDLGGRMTQLSTTATSVIGTLAPGNYEILYSDATISPAWNLLPLRMWQQATLLVSTSTFRVVASSSHVVSPSLKRAVK